MEKYYIYNGSSVGSDIAYYMQELGFEPLTPHFFTLKMSEH